MTKHPRSHVSIDNDDGRPLAAADIDVVDASLAQASLHVEAGHLPVGTRTRLVDAVLDDPEINSCEHVHVTIPAGDTEILDCVRERCDGAEARAAGASCLIDADLPPTDRRRDLGREREAE